jgi:uncharacterized membrane protein YjgN (DUF898 family)
MTNSKRFTFDGDAASYLGIGIASFFLVLLTVGIAIPWVIVMRQKWVIHHTMIDGKRLRFTGTGGQLFGKFIVWLLLCYITLGIYSLWVVPRMQKWVTENTDFE